MTTNTQLLELIRVKSATSRYKRYTGDVLKLMLCDASSRRKKSATELTKLHGEELNEMMEGLYAAGRSKYSYVIEVADLTAHMRKRVSVECMWKFYELIAVSTLESQIKHELWKRQQWTLVDYEQSAPEWSGRLVRRLTRAQRLEERKQARRRAIEDDEKVTSETYYYANGAISHVNYVNKNGSLHNRNGFARISYYADGAVQQMSHYIDGKLHHDDEPSLIEYDTSGNILRVEHWKNGRKIHEP